MRRCLSCSAPIVTDEWRCVECGWAAGLRDDVHCFAPHISGATESYDPAWYEELASLEAGNFWFAARNRLLGWLAKTYLPATGKYLEVGCGTGFVLQMLHRTLPSWRVCATEAQHEGIGFAKKRVSDDVEFFQMDACAIPFRNEFDAVGAFDVIEHISDDQAAIGEIYAALKPRGIFLVSVPQHMFLWSKYDEVGCHFRRYSAKELEDKLERAGFSIRMSTSFNSLLLPLMALSRVLKKGFAQERLDVLEELRISPAANGVLSAILRVEFLLVKLGVRFPAGGSRIVVAQKPLS